MRAAAIACALLTSRPTGCESRPARNWDGRGRVLLGNADPGRNFGHGPAPPRRGLLRLAAGPAASRHPS